MNDEALADVMAAATHLSGLSGADCSDVARFDDVVAAMHSVCAMIAAAERKGCDQSAIRTAATLAREAHALSPFVYRLQTWPRGYPGDFETIEYLLSQRVRAPQGTLGFWIEYYALSTLIAQQHRNKVSAQAREVRRVLKAGGPARVLVIAAGSCPDLAEVLGLLQERECRIVLNDGDPDALAFSLARLADAQHRLHAVPGNVIRSVGRLAQHGPFDLVLAGGLFDYLPDRAADVLVRAVWQRLLAPGGRFFFTNLGRRNPYRVWMEYLADWRLIERSEAELLQLVTSACGTEAVCSTELDATRLTWLVSVDRPA